MARLVCLLTTMLALLAGPAQASTLVHHWKADSDAVDFIAGNNGSLVGGATFAAGQSGQAFSFDSSDDYISIPDAPSHHPAGSFTIDAYAATTQASGPGQIVTQYECANFCPTGNADGVWEIEIRDGRGWAYIRVPGDIAQELTGGPLINDGGFHHVALIRDNEAAKLALYVDGVVAQEQDLAASGPIADTDGEADPATIGAQIQGGLTSPFENLNGKVDEVRFWDGVEYPDKTPPTVTPNVSGTSGDNGWYRGDIAVTWAIADQSVIRSQTGCDPSSVTSDIPTVTFTCSAHSAGGDGSGSVTVKRDATAPSVICSPAPPLAQSAVGAIMAATVNDSLSGPVAQVVTVPADTHAAGPHTASLTGKDLAGNTATVTCAYNVQAPLEPPLPVTTTVAITQIATLPSPKACVSRRRFRIHLRGVKTNKIVRAQIKLNKSTVRTVKGKALNLPIDLRGLPKGRVKVTVTVTDATGAKRVGTRVYHTCVPGRKKKA